MKLVIDIPDHVYEHAKSMSEDGNDEYDAMRAIAKGEKERPHGEWIPCKSTRTGQVTNIDYKCSKCSHHKDRPVPYCEICGAIMKKEGEAE